VSEPAQAEQRQAADQQRESGAYSLQQRAPVGLWPLAVEWAEAEAEAAEAEQRRRVSEPAQAEQRRAAEQQRESGRLLAAAEEGTC
jgi:hypothetical protein